MVMQKKLIRMIPYPTALWSSLVFPVLPLRRRELCR
jgi:hypothetical protein